MTDNSNRAGGEKKTPPYISYKTFSSYFGAVKDTGVPDVIDRSTLRNLSGGNQKLLLSALEYFGLVDPTGKPTKALHAVVDANELDRKKFVGELFRKHYTFLFSNGLNLEKATQKQVMDALAAEGNTSLNTTQKVYAFAVAMAKEAGVPLSHFLMKRAPAKPRMKTPRAAPERREADEKNPPPASPATPVPAGFVTYSFPLRRDLNVALSLPGDLTSSDVGRLGRWLATLPVED